MFLFLSVILLCLLLAVASDIVKLLRLSQLLRLAGDPEASENLLKQVNEARAELERVRQCTAASGHYVQTIKLLRAENKVKDAEAKLRLDNSSRRLKVHSVDLIAGYAFKALLSLTLFVISFRNRYTPVMIFDERFNLKPLEGLLSFPTGIRNAISVPMWAFSCNTAFRLVYDIIKGK